MGDPVVTRGKCAACDCETTEDNKVYRFDYWKLDLCKSCFIQLGTAQLEELRKDVEKHPSIGCIRPTYNEVIAGLED